MHEDQAQQVKQATDIVRLVGEHVALKPKGREYVGLCPFHEDRNPSMYVVPNKQIYHCFVCGASGDAFSFVMNYHKLDFRKALEHLAKLAGIVLQTQAPSPRAQKKRDEKEQIAEANERAVRFFRAMLADASVGQVARGYLQDRGFNEEAIEAFQIGYAPDGWDHLVQAAQKKGWDSRGMLAAGLVAPRKQGNGHYDKLRHRLIFPICDGMGRPIAFGGRKLRDEDEPKYLNSPETALFNKSATLYGLHLARRPIIAERTAVVVEGYTDVVACHQAGVKNVVATLGTAFTAQHAAALRHVADRVVLIFDADDAGMKAADRAVDTFLAEEVDVSVAVLPDGKDPAELLGEADGLERWQHTVKHAEDALSYMLRRVRQSLDGQDTVTGRQRVAEAFLQRIAAGGVLNIKPTRRGFVMQRLVELLGMPEREIVGALRRHTGDGGGPRASAPKQEVVGIAAPAGPGGSGAAVEEDLQFVEQPASVTLSISRAQVRALQIAERDILGCILTKPDCFDCQLEDGQSLDEAITLTDFVTPKARMLFAWLIDRHADAPISFDNVLTALGAEGRDPWVRLATETHMQVDRQTQGASDRVTELLKHAAQALINARRESEFEQQKAEAQDDDAKLSAVLSHRRQMDRRHRIPLAGN